MALEEQDSPSAGEVSGEPTEAPTEPEACPAPAQTKRSRSPRTSEMPPVKNEELVPGTTFTGKSEINSALWCLCRLWSFHGWACSCLTVAQQLC